MNRETQEAPAPITSKSIFQEDVVCLASNRDKVGLVIQNALDSEDESDSEDEERITEGHVLVSWYPKGIEEEIEERMLKVVDRSLLPGDVVRRINLSKGTMKGYVSRVDVDVSLKVVGTNHILRNVKCSQLIPLQEFYPGLVVVRDAWIGVVDDVSIKLTLKLKNGARCCIEGEQVNTLTDITDQRDEGSPFYCQMFYPGQCVASTYRSFKDVQWINGPRPVFSNSQRITCVVEEVSVLSVKVHWQMYGYTGKAEQLNVPVAPDPTVSTEDIPRLISVNHFKEASIEIGDKAFYVLRECDLPKNSAFGKKLAVSSASASTSDTTPGAAASSVAASLLEASSTVASSASAPSASAEVSSAAAVCSQLPSITASMEGASNSDASATAAFPSSAPLTSAVSTSAPAPSSAVSTPDASCEAGCSAGASTSSVSNALPSTNTSHEFDSQKKTQHSENSSKSIQKPKEKATQDDQHEDDRDSYSSEDSADDEDSDHGDNEKDSRAAVSSNAGTRRHDTRHQTSGTTSRSHAARRRRHYTRKKKKHHMQVRLAAGERVCVEVVSTRTTVAVKWQDNTNEYDIISTDLLPVLHVDDLEFFPGDFVVDKTDSSIPSCYGVIQRVDGAQRTCEVKWLKDTDSNLQSCVSVYDIGDHPDFSFRPGDVVMRLTDVDDNSTSANECNVNDQKNGIPPCGQVVEVNSDGKVEVIWTDQSRTEISPEFLYVVHTEDGDDWSSSANDNTNSDEEWETTSDVSSDQEQYHVNPLEDIIMRSLAAVQGNRQENQVVENNDNHDENQEIAEEKAESSTADHSAKERDVRPRSEGGSVVVDNKDSFSMIAQVHESHRYFAKESHPVNPRQFISTIRKEIIVLKSHLPPGVSVKGYENRMDLFTILIHGPADTPYEDGVFIFDLQLPDDYPKSPPKVSYLSQCSGRLNPNLYEDGTVCVSLLGTWNGKGTETWTSKSSICQLIISLQGLILCEEPYYNEAGYEKHKGSVEGAENSRVYNEMVIIKLLQSIENIIRRPSEAFQEEINEYKNTNLPKLLDRVESWMISFAPVKFLDENFANRRTLNGQFRKPGFPLLPFSYGFCLTLFRAWKNLSKLLSVLL